MVIILVSSGSLRFVLVCWVRGGGYRYFVSGGLWKGGVARERSVIIGKGDRKERKGECLERRESRKKSV